MLGAGATSPVSAPASVDVAIESVHLFVTVEYGKLFSQSDATGFQHPLWLDEFYRRLAPERDAEPCIVSGRDRDSGALVFLLPMMRRTKGGITLLESCDLGVGDYAAPVARRLLPHDLTAEVASVLPPFDLLRIRPVREEHVRAWQRFFSAPAVRADFSAHAVNPDIPFAEWRARSYAPGFRGMLDRKKKRFFTTPGAEVRLLGKAGQTSYESDYDAMSKLQRWATERSIAVLCLHHTRKGGADDSLEALSGSNGLSACADTTLALDRVGNGITPYVRGRDVEERESAMKFTAGLWTMVRDASSVRRSSERCNILVALEKADEPMSPTEIANVTSLPMLPPFGRSKVTQLLRDGTALRTPMSETRRQEPVRRLLPAAGSADPRTGTRSGSVLPHSRFVISPARMVSPIAILPDYRFLRERGRSSSSSFLTYLLRRDLLTGAEGKADIVWSTTRSERASDRAGMPERRAMPTQRLVQRCSPSPPCWRMPAFFPARKCSMPVADRDTWRPAPKRSVRPARASISRRT